MPRDRIKKAAIPNVGYGYQLLHGIKTLTEWLEAPHKFAKVKFECDNQEDAPQGLDDIVIEKADGRIEYIQVKYTPNQQELFLTWEWLTEKKSKNTKSNIQKWFNAFKQIPKGKLESAKLITNRIPDECFAKILSEKNTIILDLISQETFEIIQKQLGDSNAVRQFFGNFEIHHSNKGYLNLENEIKRKLQKDFGSSAYHQLHDEAEKWSRLKDFPSPDGWITYEILNGVVTRKHPEPLKEDFKIPQHYRIPDEGFHHDFIKRILESNGKIITLVGPPGRGKSTYLSVLCKKFRENRIPFVRHHYYLSREYFSTDRYSYYHIQNTINSQIRNNYPDIIIPNGSDTQLKESLKECGEYFKKINRKFLVIIDGLDHVWRENNYDKQPLDELFNGIFPLPDNVTLIIGTQPVDDTQLPNRLLACSPRNEWVELPPMNSSSIKQYLSAFFNTQNDYTLNSAAESIQLRTGGHPLHLIYTVEYLANNGIPLTKLNIERIPGDMSHSVSEYYQSLWIHLKKSQKNALALLVEYPFYWPFSSFTAAIDVITGFSMEDLNGIKYLLYKTISGYKIFHDSLSVFIKGEASYTQRIEDSYPRVHEWLLQSAPDNIRNMWLWLVEARNGDYKNLFTKIDRNWVIERLSEGYSFNEIIWLLQEVETIAFEQKRFSHQYKIHHLRERVSRAGTQGIYLHEISKLSLKDSRNKDLLNHAVSEVNNVSPGYTFAVSEILYDDNKKKDAESIAWAAYEILQDEREFEEHERYLGISDEEIHGYETLGYINALDVEELNFPHFSKEEFNIFNAFVKGIVKSRNLQYLQSLRKQKMDIQYVRHLEDAIVLLSKELSFDLSVLPEFTEYGTGILSQLIAISKNIKIANYKYQKISFSDFDFSSFYGSHDRISIYYFQKLLQLISGKKKSDFTDIIKLSGNERGECLQKLLRQLESHVEEIAKHIKTGNYICIVDFYRIFDNFLDKSSKSLDSYSCYDIFHIALFDVWYKYHSIFSSTGVSEFITFDQLDLLKDCKWFVPHVAVQYSIDHEVRIFDSTTAEIIINDILKADLEDLQTSAECATNNLTLCLFANLHGFRENIHDGIKIVLSYLLSYEDRKDGTILDVLEAIEHLSLIDTAAAKELLLSIAPQIEAIFDFTDGKGIWGVTSEYNRLLAKLSTGALCEKFKWDCFNENWALADHDLAGRFTTALNSPALSAIAKTSLSDDVFKKLEHSVQSKVPFAEQLWNTAVDFSGNIIPLISDHYNSTPSSVEHFNEDVALYPPSELKTLCDMALMGKMSITEDYFTRWFAYWKENTGPHELINNVALLLDTFKRSIYSSRISSLLDMTFDLCMQTSGRNEAFRFLVSAYALDYGWNSGFTHISPSLERLVKVSCYYRDRIPEFITETCKINLLTNELSVPGARLVYLYAQSGQSESAIEHSKAIVDSFIEDTSCFVLTIPKWAENTCVCTDGECDYDILLERRHSILPSVKLWAIKQTALLLINPLTQRIILEKLWNEARGIHLETDILEFLSIFWIAKQFGNIPQVNFLGRWSNQSLLIDYFIENISAEIQNNGVIIHEDDSLYVTEYKSSRLDECIGRFIPKAFIHQLQNLENASSCPFMAQFAYEWDRMMSHERPILTDTSYFVDRLSPPQSGLFITKEFRCGLSAFLKTLSHANTFWRFPDQLTFKYSSFAFPIDPLFSIINPFHPALGIPSIPESNEIEDYIIQLSNSIREDEQSELLYFYHPYIIDKYNRIEIEILKIHGYIHSIEEISDTFQSFDVYSLGFCESALLSSNFRFNLGSQKNASDIFPSSIPFAIRRRMPVQGYLAQTMHGGAIELPFLKSSHEASIHPTDKGLDIFCNKNLIGNWSFWNEGWRATTENESKGHHGKRLVVYTKFKHLISDMESDASFLVRSRKFSTSFSRDGTENILYRCIKIAK